MPFTIKNIELTTESLRSEVNNAKNINMKKCVKLLQEEKYSTDDIKALLPCDRHHIKFELSGTNCDFANSLRRCLINETPVKSMTFDDCDFETDDNHILIEVIRQNIHLIPINQEIDYTNAKLQLNITNKNQFSYQQGIKTRSLNIYTSDISSDISTNNISSDISTNNISSDISTNGIDGAGKSKKNKKSPHGARVAKIDVKNMFVGNICIARLRPGKTLTIKNINIVEGLAFDDAGQFANVASTYYEDASIYDSPFLSNTTNSTLVNTPTNFILGYTTYNCSNDVNPYRPIIRACEVLSERCEAILKDISQIPAQDKSLKKQEKQISSYISDKIQIKETDDGLLYIYISNEYWTVANLLSRYCYLLDPNIPFVVSSIVHPNVHKCYIKIKHAEPIKLLKDAITKIISDYNTVKSAFEKKYTNK